MEIVNTYTTAHASQIKDAATMAVLTIDACDQYAVYVGIVKYNSKTLPSERIRSSEFVAANGTKQNLNQAQQYFPSCKAKNYRA
jgi:hypothetical protein